MKPDGAELLAHVTPFQFLSAARRATLVTRLEERRYQDGERLIVSGERSRDVFLIASGKVDCIDDREPPVVLSTIQEGHYFGERASLFDRPREVTVRAAGPVIAFTLPGKDFLQLVDEVPVFAQALATALKFKQGLFVSYRKLYARILSLLDRREFLLRDLIPAYRELHPALHPRLHEKSIDTDALGYAVARLPEAVSRTSVYFLTNAMPPLYADPDSKFDRAKTAARRRSAWQLMPSKTLILLRDGLSDVTDFLTCLCLYAVEAKKIRKRVRSSETLRELRELCERPDAARAAKLLAGLDLSEEERAGILAIWPNDYWVRLRDILLHHEDVAIECDHVVDDYNSRASEIWVRQIRQEAATLVDLEDPELEVHVISSNTHSVGNCLSAYLTEHAEEILAWGRRERPDLTGEPSAERPWGAGWRSKADLVYVTARDYLKANPAEAKAAAKAEAATGRRHMKATAFTGIEVQLFDLRRLCAEKTDPEVKVGCVDRPVLLINIDYAFGQQATEILATLLFAFGDKVRSLNVLGKAGGLVGHRGEILLPAAVLLQTNDELYPLPNRDLPGDDLRALAPDIPVHEGPVLTVAGTLLQDRALLHFYRRIWKCVGLEMEGSFFARQLISAIETGVASPDIKTRFVYYTSDVPLDPDETLSESMKPWEGVPPLYAITRGILNRIFQS
ncbi:MAG: cyclic nucleotide-binding domain-containing protein [Planctomycetes bacterium]|nr:cyclic nucleotide-binding domain-containing protein [Planctomycetota bacterium]